MKTILTSSSKVTPMLPRRRNQSDMQWATFLSSSAVLLFSLSRMGCTRATPGAVSSPDSQCMCAPTLIAELVIVVLLLTEAGLRVAVLALNARVAPTLEIQFTDIIPTGGAGCASAPPNPKTCNSGWRAFLEGIVVCKLAATSLTS